ncbi:TraB/GumN family protein, partial [Burkholderia gladioli]|nr:TraB/GumN family protein [Burkholderia gladioli]
MPEARAAGARGAGQAARRSQAGGARGARMRRRASHRRARAVAGAVLAGACL